MNVRFSKTLLGAAALVALTTAVLPGAASAGEAHNRVNRQQSRINRGVADGQLTQHEYNRDENRLDRINNSRKADLSKNGGHLTPGEKQNLNRRLNGDSHQIYFTKHNLNHQPGAKSI
jgi:hypothetical protein